jgi:5-methylcytosine-specific restriction protein A
MKLKMLKPRIAEAPMRLQPARTQVVERIRGRQLQRIRAEHLRREPLCRRCMQRGYVTIGVHVDHIVALINGGTETPENRQTLCKPCHDEKTNEDLCR